MICIIIINIIYSIKIKTKKNIYNFASKIDKYPTPNVFNPKTPPVESYSLPNFHEIKQIMFSGTARAISYRKHSSYLFYTRQHRLIQIPAAWTINSGSVQFVRTRSQMPSYNSCCKTLVKSWALCPKKRLMLVKGKRKDENQFSRLIIFNRS